MTWPACARPEPHPTPWPRAAVSLAAAASAAADIAASMQKVAQTMHQTRASFRPLYRVVYTRGDRHIEAIVRDCLARRQPADVVRVRLLVASDAAQVLDGGAP